MSTGTFAPPGRSLPFAVAFLLVPAIWLAATMGGWALILPPLVGWWLFAFLDQIGGDDDTNADPSASETDLSGFRRITLIWPPVQVATMFGLLVYVTRSGHLSPAEELAVFAGMGVVSGTVGIVYAHELMHRAGRFERWLGDVLMASVLYSHFRSTHLLVHHVHVGTPRDASTARYNEGFHRFFFRTVPAGLASALRAEAARLRRRGRPQYDPANPFWTYAALQGVFVAAALAIGGWWGLVLFAMQAAVAIWQLELVNYVEHYGLVRRQGPDGRYEPVRAHHSWNVSRRASNLLLINLQRHADHHMHPGRRYPVLQTMGPETAPELPHGYPVMTALALVPPLWRRVMNPHVRAWRGRFYPGVTDWPASGTDQVPIRVSAARSARSA